MENTQWEYCLRSFGDDCTKSDCIRQTQDILDFANMVFSMEYSSTDFEALLPKAYSPEHCGIVTHHMIREEDRIKALIDTYPITLRLRGENGRAVRAAYVGTVSVHPNARGKGYMIELMRRTEEYARKQGYALMILDGERHRYQYYGFERAGIQYDFRIETGNITHCCARLYKKEYMAAPVFCFAELQADSPYLDGLYKLYQRKLLTARTREDFWWCLQSYSASTYVILRDGEPVGYVNLSEDRGTLREFEILDMGDCCRVLYDLMMEFDMEQLRVSVGMDEKDKIMELERACDSCSAAMSHQIKILDYEAVLGLLLDWKQKYDTLVISEYVLGIRDEQEDSTENYLLSVTEDGVSVARTERAADTVLEKMELVRVLTTSIYFVEQQRGESNKIKNAPAGWFPLPFHLPEADTF